MATNPTPIIFKITDAGKQAALSANSASPKIQLNLTQVAIGSGQYVPNGSETSLLAEISRNPLVSGGVEVTSNTLRFSSTITFEAKNDVYEIGLLTDDNILFAVAASTMPLFTVHPGIKFAASFGLSLNEVGQDNITVTTDPSGALSLVIMEGHLAAPDPHPQYLNVNRFQLLLQTLIPIGYQYTTHMPVNPKPAFDELMGIDTAWRRIAGKIMLATDPSDDYIKDVGIVLGQQGMTELANQQRPHVYPLQTTHLFERYDPSTIINTLWSVVSNKSSIDEGEGVIFTVSANNLPDGQILDWIVSEGVLNAQSNNIDAPDKTQSGTAILTNGQITIEFETTGDDNNIEAQKHVRLTIGAPADLAINVPINDLGNTEQIIHISQSTQSGIDLDEYYKTQAGNYPKPTDRIRFIVDAGVDVIAPNTLRAAIISGANMPAAATIIIENRGRIIGRGGDGGRSARIRGWTLSFDTYHPDFLVPAQKGADGGTAIKGNMTVENYGMISGGGGGGGGQGAWMATGTESKGAPLGFVVGGGGGTGGGAPYGKRSMNEGTWQRYITDPDVKIPRFQLPPNSPILYAVHLFTSGALVKTIFNNENINTSYKVTNAQSQDIYIPLDAANNANYLGDFDGFYTVRNAIDRYYGAGQSTSGSKQLKMSSNATLELGGAGGYGGGETAFASFIFTASRNNTDVSVNYGGAGGNIGEAGAAGVINKLLTLDPQAGDDGDHRNGELSLSQLSHYEDNAAGGLAGFIKEGSVTITNFASGTTKGR